MQVARLNVVVLTTVGEQLSRISGTDSNYSAKPEHRILIQCSGFLFLSMDVAEQNTALHKGCEAVVIDHRQTAFLSTHKIYLIGYCMLHLQNEN